MNSHDEQWWILQAGEYVLGTLPATERATFEKLVKHDLVALEYVTWWEQRLAHLDASVEHTAPPPQVWQNISDQLAFSNTVAAPKPAIDQAKPHDSTQPVSTAVKRPLNQHSAMGRRVTFWRGLTGLATAACMLLGFMLWQTKLDPVSTVQPSFEVISVVSDNTAAAFWVIDAAPDSKQLRVTAVAPPALEAGKSFELWVVKNNDQGVASMGLLPVQAGQSIMLSVPDLVNDAAAFAVSLEPEGGSPDSAPTGPVLYQGEFQKVTAI